MKFNKGDIVEIIDSQDVNGMKELIGSIQIIDRYCTHTDDGDWYLLKDNSYIWSSNWLQEPNSFELNENDLINLLKE